MWRHIPAGAHPLNAHFIIHASGRWNRPGEYGCLYTALSVEDATAEYQKAHLRSGIVGERPRELVSIDVFAAPILDLTSGTIRRRVGLRLADIRSDDEAAVEQCRAVADSARDGGYRGILAPSAASRLGQVLAIYLEGHPHALQMHAGGDREVL